MSLPQDPVPPGVKAQLTVRLMADGRVGVSGPIGDTVLCLGLLELAKATVLSQAERAPAGPLVQPVSGAALRALPKVPPA